MENDNSAANTGIQGRKIFFLHSSVIIQNELASELTRHEYEVYVTREHANLPRVLKNFPDSIVFINLDDGLSGKEWENWLRDLEADPKLASVGIGILTASKNEESRQKYAADSRVTCGYTVLCKPDMSKAVTRILETLHSMNARGQRKFLRAVPDHEELTTINIPFNSRYYNGTIKDISVAGLACTFMPDPQLKKSAVCKDMQIKLQGILLKGEGVVFGSRLDDQIKIYVFLFTQGMDPEAKNKIRHFIQSFMQAKMDALLK